MKKHLTITIISAISLASCGGSGVDVKATLEGHQAQLKQCYDKQDASICDAAIATLDRDIPLLENACSSGNSDACGLFPGYEQVPDMLRSFKNICVDNTVDPSIPDELGEMAQQGMKAGCDRIRMKLTGPKL